MAGDVSTGYLSRNGVRVPLPYTSGLLADFMREIREMEEEFAVRCGARPSAVEGDGTVAVPPVSVC
ncbi:hypothetical protein ACIGXM_11280 [Kitasatospora sp. NPDC052896]|uniref:hypothetical protein n=1 Tax=Kitasatospora sp. NPDC052896 TaxID=3364061 RepID=UPI0037CCB531